jgi:hypothetical protein
MLWLTPSRAWQKMQEENKVDWWRGSYSRVSLDLCFMPSRALGMVSRL